MYIKGDIVLIPFPFTDLSGVNVRPAVVLSISKKSQDIIVAFITSQTKRSSQFCIQIHPDKDNGLKVVSVILCDKLATLDKKVVVGKIGICGKDLVTACDNELRCLFAL